MGLSQHETSRRAGFDQGALSRFEATGRGLSIENLERLLSVLGLEVLPADRDAVDHGSPSADIVPHDLVNGQCQPVHTEAR